MPPEQQKCDNVGSLSLLLGLETENMPTEPLDCDVPVLLLLVLVEVELLVGQLVQQLTPT